ncbi:hypothetical protein CKO31_02420 [Thiohalocapsa halophila]|uniref:Uncharacterized protein n=1 Tax=Thiohalocapsa halophila TaxID=69359 RepID=A0ABS1CCI7_9GAMM|nr:hypothetical protein [Thiohalocapsa halophila]MBK1629610.1 hypothetical protein [Thiohalocapsa halophila]
MTTRSSDNWLGKPGGFDALHCSLLFPSASSYGIPRLEAQDWALPDDFRLLPYRSRLDRLDLRRDICHCFLDDYRNACCWPPRIRLTALIVGVQKANDETGRVTFRR